MMSKALLNLLMGEFDTELVFLLLEAIAYKNGGIELTQQDMLDFIKSDKKIDIDLDVKGTLILKVKEGK